MIQIEEIGKFKELENFVKNSELSYKEAILEYYKKLGESFGFSIRENFSVIKYTVNLGKIDLLWVEPNITFTIEFSNLENLIGKLFRVIEFSPNKAILLLSSLSGCKPRDVEKLINNSKIFDNFRREKFIIIDLSERKIISL